MTTYDWHRQLVREAAALSEALWQRYLTVEYGGVACDHYGALWRRANERWMRRRVAYRRFRLAVQFGVLTPRYHALLDRHDERRNPMRRRMEQVTREGHRTIRRRTEDTWQRSDASTPAGTSSTWAGAKASIWK